jgi:hypothetical protein
VNGRHSLTNSIEGEFSEAGVAFSKFINWLMQFLTQDSAGGISWITNGPPVIIDLANVTVLAE